MCTVLKIYLLSQNCEYICAALSFDFVLKPNLLSAHRNLMRRIDAVEVSEELSGKGDPVTLFVFTDSLEVGAN